MLIFRSAAHTDIPAVVRLLADDQLGQQRERYEEPLPVNYYKAFALIERDPNNELIVVELDGRIIGTMQLTFIPSLSFQGSMRMQIEAVRIDRRYRGHGLGQKMVQWAIKRAREANCRFVQLTTNKTRKAAHHFYERLGFVASHEGMKLDLEAGKER